MPIHTNYPGVYIEEIPSGSRPLGGVATSTAAFVDCFARGPVTDDTHAHPVQVSSFRDFERTFGGLHPKSEASYAILQFFANGGETAFVVRADDGGGAEAVFRTAVHIPPEYGMEPTNMTIAAKSQGDWGNALRACILTAAEGEFDLEVREVALRGGQETVVATETFHGLSLGDGNAGNFAPRVVGEQSELVDLRYEGPSVDGAVPDGEWLPNTSTPEATHFQNLAGGRDALPPSAERLIGALENGLDHIAPSIFNILCLPVTATYEEGEASQAIAAAMSYCERKRAFMIVDIPASVATVDQMEEWHRSHGGTANHTAAVYYPRLEQPDPLRGYRPRNVGASGTLAGVYARTDANRGVWKAPAGIEAVLEGVEIVSKVTDDENGRLNPLGINCLRTFPVYGNIAWGARTLAGADLLDSPWKYVNIRRLAYYIEVSLSQGLEWTVFESNDETLWRRIRTEVSAFCAGLYAGGALAGSTPDKAYFVTCDSTTTTPSDVADGIVNIVVGFAPLKPAEFVILQIAQTAGQE